MSTIVDLLGVVFELYTERDKWKELARTQDGQISELKKAVMSHGDYIKRLEAEKVDQTPDEPSSE